MTKKFLVDVIVTYQIAGQDDEQVKNAVDDLKEMMKEKSLCFSFGNGSYDGYVMKKIRFGDLGFTPILPKKRKKGKK
jgi:hypothetical protein